MTEPRPVTYLFSDIEGSTRLWETDPEGAARALARHDRLSREVVQRHHGTLVKMTGDGLHAAFDQPDAAIAAVIELQKSIAVAENGIPALKIRCGLHLGADQRRDNDFYGPAVNRAARIMSAAHGDQVLLSQAVVERAAGRFPDGAAVRELGHVRLKDLASPERIYQLVHPSLRAEFPALRSLASTPNNLPQQLNSFVGREREMGEVRRLLSHGRLVTLLAMGGIGKSRLSIQLGAEVLEDYPDGVWLVELAPLSDPAAVAQAVATVLGVREEPGGTVTDALLRFVRERQLLLLLDNCEHLVQACAELAKALLQASPGLRILATSRDALRIAGESSYQLQTLSVPSATTSSPDALMQHEAVCLFVDRAMSSQPAFVLNERNAAAVAEICHRLDGIPLALELAAARARTLSVGVIASRLNDRFKLLVSGDRAVLPRQQTLRALIDWSYEMLSGAEQRLFQRLSVFAGGCSLEAAEEVTASDDIAPADVLDLLCQLVEKSLVVLDIAGDRYRMLDTVRQYAIDALRSAGHYRDQCARHVRYFLGLAERARPQLGGPAQHRSLLRLDQEHENMLAAHAYCDTVTDGAESGLRLVHALRPYWMSRGLLTLGLRATEEALGRTDGDIGYYHRFCGLFGAGQFCYFMGRHSDAVRYLTQSRSIAAANADEKLNAVVLQPLGMAHIGEGDLAAAGKCLHEAAELAQSHGNTREQAIAQNALGMLHRIERRLDLAAAAYTTALQFARNVGDRDLEAICLINLAMVAIMQDQRTDAVAMVRAAIAIAGEINSVLAAQAALDVCVGLAAKSGQPATAAQLLGAIEQQAERSGFGRDRADQEFLAPLVEQVQNELGPESFRSAVQDGNSMSPREAMGVASVLLDAIDGRARL